MPINNNETTALCLSNPWSEYIIYSGYVFHSFITCQKDQSLFYNFGHVIECFKKMRYDVFYILNNVLSFLFTRKRFRPDQHLNISFIYLLALIKPVHIKRIKLKKEIKISKLRKFYFKTKYAKFDRQELCEIPCTINWFVKNKKYFKSYPYQKSSKSLQSSLS